MSAVIAVAGEATARLATEPAKSVQSTKDIGSARIGFAVRGQADIKSAPRPQALG
jgi:hypothetical protein